MEQNNDGDGPQLVDGISRRTVLKLVAGAPLALTFALTLSPLMRYFKPTMKSFSPFQEADLPGSAFPHEFSKADFPEEWSCIPFVFNLSSVEFNPEKRVVRPVPSFIIRLPNHQYVAYSRRCPYQRCTGLLEYVKNRLEVNCGCAPGDKCCCVRDAPFNPVLFCPRDEGVYDLANQCRRAHGPTWNQPRQLKLHLAGDVISVVGLEMPCIV